MKNQKIASHGGTVFDSITKQGVESIPISLPSIKEQKGIAEVLLGVDDVIDGVRGVLEKAEVVEAGVVSESFCGE